MSLGVLVVEASTSSGELICAQARDGTRRRCSRCPAASTTACRTAAPPLIRDGAKLVETADDILEELGPLVRRVERPAAKPVLHLRELLLNELLNSRWS